MLGPEGFEVGISLLINLWVIDIRLSDKLRWWRVGAFFSKQSIKISWGFDPGFSSQRLTSYMW
jgi:hypothetical protein